MRQLLFIVALLLLAIAGFSQPHGRGVASRLNSIGTKYLTTYGTDLVAADTISCPDNKVVLAHVTVDALYDGNKASGEMFGPITRIKGVYTEPALRWEAPWIASRAVNNPSFYVRLINNKVIVFVKGISGTVSWRVKISNK